MNSPTYVIRNYSSRAYASLVLQSWNYTAAVHHAHRFSSEEEARRVAQEEYGWDTVEVIPIREVENSEVSECLASYSIWACDLCDTPIRDGQVTGNSAICSDCIRKSLAK